MIPSIFSADFWHGATQPLCKPIECKYASFIVVFRQNMVRVELLLLCFNSYAFLLSRLSSFLSPLMSLKSVLSKYCRNFYGIHINLASCGTLGGQKTVTATSKTQLARMNICSDWGKPHIKQKFDRNLQGHNLQGRNLRGLTLSVFSAMAGKLNLNFL